MQWFYSAQLKGYIIQLVRMFSGFKYKTGDGTIKEIPVLYGDLTRQVGAILRDNSENKVPSAPRMALYITNLELDKGRLADSSFVGKTYVREREINKETNQYTNNQGRNYTVEKIMPTPFQLTINVDIWSTNTDQKLQILEQLLTLFNPSLDLQVNDNYLDWSSLSIVYLENITWTSRTIPSGTESEIDVATLSFAMPIFIGPPAKVKKMGVITDIVTRVHSSMDVNNSTVDPNIVTNFTIDDQGNIIQTETQNWYDFSEDSSTNNSNIIDVIKTNYRDTTLVIFENKANIISSYNNDYLSWDQFFNTVGGQFKPGISQLRLKRNDWPYDIVGLVNISNNNVKSLDITWDWDTFPEDTIIPGPTIDKNKIDFIIDPQKTDPRSLGLSVGTRIMILNDIGDDINKDGADAWKSNAGDDFIARENDIIEWTGDEWVVVFDASENLVVYSNQHTSPIYSSNLYTGVQYKYENGGWLLSVDGDYSPGSWRFVL